MNANKEPAKKITGGEVIEYGMRLNWNEGIDRLIQVIAIAAGVWVAIDLYINHRTPGYLAIAWLIGLPLGIAVSALFLKAVILWIASGFTKSPKKRDP